MLFLKMIILLNLLLIIDNNKLVQQDRASLNRFEKQTFSFENYNENENATNLWTIKNVISNNEKFKKILKLIVQNI